MEHWRTIQRGNFTSCHLLAEFLKLNPAQTKQLKQNHPFTLNVPLRLAEKMQKGTLDDPILKQFVPLNAPEQLSTSTPFENDPVKDISFCLTPKLLQKYEGRALLLCTSACAMHCRFCFRQHFPYERNRKHFDTEIREIKNDPSLREVILSGGDPLSLSDEILSDLLEQLDATSHLNRVRFHTRFPIGIPERIDNSFLSVLKKRRLQVKFVIHCNHPLELDIDVLGALKKIQGLGIPILSHSVLLKGINDSESTLIALFEKMINNGILPYYLNQLDKVKEGEPFEVNEEIGRELIKKIRRKLPGYGVPTYVREIPGEKNKVPLE